MAYSMDLRRLVVRAVTEQHLSRAEASRRFGVSYHAVKQWVRREREGDLAPRKPGPTRPRVLTEEDLASLRRFVEERPGITSEEAAERLGHKITAGHVRTVWIRMGLRFKKRRSTPRSSTDLMSPTAASSGGRSKAS